MMTKLKVRCCCMPQKVYGTMEIPTDMAQLGRRLYIETLTRDFDRINRDVVVLEVSEIIHSAPHRSWLVMDEPRRELALKYEGDDETFEQKLARLRNVREFCEAVEFE